MRRAACPARRPRPAVAQRDRGPEDRVDRLAASRRRPGRSRARSPVQSTIVDSTPTRHGPAVEHEVDVVAEVGADVGRGGRAHPAEAVRRTARRSPPPNAREQRERDRMVGHAEPDRVAAAGHLVGHPPRTRRTTSVSGPGQHASASAPRRRVGHVDAQSSSCVGVGEVHDDRMVGRPALHRVQPRERVAGSSASAPSPYTVSVGNATSPPRRSAATATAISSSSSHGRGYQ